MDYYDSQMLALQIFCESPMLVRLWASFSPSFHTEMNLM